MTPINSLDRIKAAAFPLAFMILGLAVVLIAHGYKVGSMNKPEGGFWPFAIGLGLLAAGAIDLAAEWRKPASLKMGAWVKPLLLILAFFLWPFLLAPLGFLPVTFLATVAIAKILGLEGWLKPLALAAGTTLASHLIFKVWFYLDLPDGELIELVRTWFGG